MAKKKKKANRPSKKTSKEKLSPKSPHFWVASTYFAEGFPYTLVNTIAEAMFTEFGASLKAVGLTSVFHLPWNIKFLWGPYVDRYGTKRIWLLGIQAALLASMVALALAAALPTGMVLTVASAVFVFMAFFSASQDIAVDGYYLEALDKDGQAQFVGYRVAAYRVAMLVAGGGLLILIKYVGWFLGLMVAALVMAGIFAYHWFFLPEPQKQKEPMRELAKEVVTPKFLTSIAAVAGLIGLWKLNSDSGFLMGVLETTLPAAYGVAKGISTSGWIGFILLTALLGVLAMLPSVNRKLKSSDSFYSRAFTDFLSQERVGVILAFVILFRVGESFLLKMRYPFLRSAGLSMDEIGFMTGVLGLIASIAAATLGGIAISRHGLRRWIWPFVISQNVLNLIYMGLAILAGSLVEGELFPRWLAGTAITLEAFGAGLGTSVFMVYIMRCCREKYKAAHMAIVTAIMSVGFTLAGIMSGFLAEAMGFGTYFFITFLVTIPGMLLIFWAPHLDEDSRKRR
jgi:PAT family beta-lactamase induction signal transducer AmpG